MFKDTVVLARLAPKPEPTDVVYFITTDQDASYPVKIGRSTNFLASSRLRQLQVGSPYRLEFFAAIRGGRADELALHALFANYHLRGEWFARSPELMAMVEKVRRDDASWRVLLRAPAPGELRLRIV